jgi:hypothetical protein
MNSPTFNFWAKIGMYIFQPKGSLHILNVIVMIINLTYTLEKRISRSNAQRTPNFANVRKGMDIFFCGAPAWHPQHQSQGPYIPTILKLAGASDQGSRINYQLLSLKHGSHARK